MFDWVDSPAERLARLWRLRALREEALVSPPPAASAAGAAGCACKCRHRSLYAQLPAFQRVHIFFTVVDGDAEREARRCLSSL